MTLPDGRIIFAHQGKNAPFSLVSLRDLSRVHEIALGKQANSLDLMTSGVYNTAEAKESPRGGKRVERELR